VVNNVVRQHNKSSSSFIWENYRDSDGQGQGTHPFGWSALTALVVIEQF
jgi:mannosyl-oligosaccharide glucosidase